MSRLARRAEWKGPGQRSPLAGPSAPNGPDWQGGEVNGIVAPDSVQLIKLVATDEVAGLQRLAAPSPAQIPNNHLLYAIQWFIFACAAAIIYVLALRKRNDSRYLGDSTISIWRPSMRG